MLSKQPLHVQAGEGLTDVGIVLIHGYGSGVFAWRHIMWPLARATGCRVLAFDRPAFGDPTDSVCICQLLHVLTAVNSFATCMRICKFSCSLLRLTSVSVRMQA
jgi:pimeloyl-ACP methyl ester carboxylesterase